jgi:hypothetical protein
MIPLHFHWKELELPVCHLHSISVPFSRSAPHKVTKEATSHERSKMTIAANQLLTAIEFDELEAKAITEGDKAAIVILVGGCEVGRIGCLHLERPIAKVTPDGLSVDVFPSPGLPDGFSIECATHEDSIVIAEALDGCFETAYLDLMEEWP